MNTARISGIIALFIVVIPCGQEWTALSTVGLKKNRKEEEKCQKMKI